ncbi:MAG: VCBS repeat-containing protein [Candidatus Bathyarchaeia archaeon]|nr:VCBS repeat-containing protein [Candidatus Bathyarchaeia archaeon]
MFFLQAYDSASNFWINSVDVEDVDGDGLNEIVISGYCWGYDSIYMFISIGSNINPNEIFWMGSYTWIISGDSYIYSIDVEDIEGDGKAEILAVGYYFNVETYAWLNYEAALSWSLTTGLIVENVNLGES